MNRFIVFTNTRVVTAASAIFKKLASILAGGGVTGFLFALATEVITGGWNDDVDILKDKTLAELVSERDNLRTNGLAWAVVTQVMAREKGNIELAFLGFM
ncbi:hypothetical protein CCY99_06015 [Helicobacter sp. 16-1353]|uniref:hypothetical protein n=1 Tax=Helicobacter sp. 16-1353 TaxID=2004996 RepID=UPI000DCEBDBA|nr:hypothetical protein [Helicobacter sp. 16-1353]RAX53145.1 hypothetical protein CCY99_06015 [Helicobacter sp. 16-1353]